MLFKILPYVNRGLHKEEEIMILIYKLRQSLKPTQAWGSE